jgi:hypothetical protein
MRRILGLVVLAALAAGSTASAAPTPTPKESAALLRVAGALSGLKAKRAVPVVRDRPARFRLRRVQRLERIYPMPVQAYDEIVYRALGLTAGRNVLGSALAASNSGTALYEPLTRKVYVASATPARKPLLRELVLALQDQHFDLRRLRAVAGNRDASLAAAGAFDGHASLVSGVLGSRSLSSHGGPLLTRFLELQRGFTSTVALRFVADLRNLGGNAAVFSALRRFPASTEQVFHLDKFLERERPVPIVLPVDAGGLRLAADNTFGELDVRTLLAVFGVPRLGHAASGWGGGRSAVYRAPGREAVAIALDWDTELDAQEWADAVALYVDEAFDADVLGQPAPTACEESTCWSLGPHHIAFTRVGARTALVFSGEVALSAAVARTLVPG